MLFKIYLLGDSIEKLSSRAIFHTNVKEHIVLVDFVKFNDIWVI